MTDRLDVQRGQPRIEILDDTTQVQQVESSGRHDTARPRPANSRLFLDFTARVPGQGP